MAAVQEHEHLCFQIAQLEMWIATSCRRDSERMRQGLAELEETQVMVSDGIDAIRHAVVEMSGLVRYTELNPDQRRSMYN